VTVQPVLRGQEDPLVHLSCVRRLAPTPTASRSATPARSCCSSTRTSPGWITTPPRRR